MFSQFSDTQPFTSEPWSNVDKQESSTQSDGSTSAGATHSDEEEVLLATSRPKRRAGRRIFKETRHPIYRGVRRRNGDKWVCELREPNKKTRIWLGTYPTPEMAARAHDVAALALRGKSACLNFADSAWRLPVPVSNDPKDIRMAASEAAELFRHQNYQEDNEVRQKISSEEEVSTSSMNHDNCKTLQENRWYLDEEAEFNMPRLITDMAEGLLLSPPHYVGDGLNLDDDMEGDVEVSLWSY